MRFRGQQTQFYIDVAYGIVFSAGFGYLLFVGMDPRIAAFQGGLVLGYFLRVWENMSVYERILEEEVAAEAEDAVAEEIETQVPGEAEKRVAEAVEEQVPTEVEETVGGRIQEEVEERVPEEVEARVPEEVEETVDERIEERVNSDIEELSGSEEDGRRPRETESGGES